MYGETKVLKYSSEQRCREGLLALNADWHALDHKQASMHRAYIVCLVAPKH